MVTGTELLRIILLRSSSVVGRMVVGVARGAASGLGRHGWYRGPWAGGKRQYRVGWARVGNRYH